MSDTNKPDLPKPAKNPNPKAKPHDKPSWIMFAWDWKSAKTMKQLGYDYGVGASTVKVRRKTYETNTGLKLPDMPTSTKTVKLSDDDWADVAKAGREEEQSELTPAATSASPSDLANRTRKAGGLHTTGSK